MNVNVSLTGELCEFIKAKISNGRYASASAVVQEAVRIMMLTEEARLTLLRNAWIDGQASGDASPADFASIKVRGRMLLNATSNG